MTLNLIWLINVWQFNRCGKSSFLSSVAFSYCDDVESVSEKGWLCAVLNCNDLQKASIGKWKKSKLKKDQKLFSKTSWSVVSSSTTRTWLGEVYHLIQGHSGRLEPCKHFFCEDPVYKKKQCTGSTTVNNQTWLQDWALISLYLIMKNKHIKTWNDQIFVRNIWWYNGRQGNGNKA